MFEGKYFLFTLEKGVGVLTLNRPPYNIFEAGFYVELGEVEDVIAQTEGIRCLVIKANGKCFSAGIDLNYLQGVSSDYVLEKLPWLQRIYGFWQEQNYPVIAAVQGLCTGSGLEFILGADIRIAAEGARFSLPEVQLGLSPDMGGTSRLTRLVGLGQAKRLILTGEEIDAQEALRIGLVNAVYEPEELMDKAMEMAAMMLKNAPVAIGLAKQSINEGYDLDAEGAIGLENKLFGKCFNTQDQKEGMDAFLNKREATFKGE